MPLFVGLNICLQCHPMYVSRAYCGVPQAISGWCEILACWVSTVYRERTLHGGDTVCGAERDKFSLGTNSWPVIVPKPLSFYPLNVEPCKCIIYFKINKIYM